MAELADALVSGTRARKGVQVQVLFPAPNQKPSIDKRNIINRWFCVY
jgi:hypothetical protein